MYRSIVVPLDCSELSEGVLPCVRQFALGLMVPVTLLHVIDAGAIRYPLSEHRNSDELTEWAAGQAASYLERVAASLAADGIEARTKVVYGEPVAAILARSDGPQDTVLAMATHGRSGLERWVLGSVAARVVQHADRPVLLIRPPTDGPHVVEPPLRTMIVPLDGSRLAESILPQAEEVARRLGLSVLLLQVVPGAAQLYFGPDFYPYSPDICEQAREAAATYLDETAGEIVRRGRLQVATRVVDGGEGGAIVDLAQATEGALIAMSTHGRSGLSRWLLGSVADKVVRSSNRPVLLIRRTEE